LKLLEILDLQTKDEIASSLLMEAEKT
jgi:hypothetical protein